MSMSNIRRRDDVAMYIRCMSFSFICMCCTAHLIYLFKSLHWTPVRVCAVHAYYNYMLRGVSSSSTHNNRSALPQLLHHSTHTRTHKCLFVLMDFILLHFSLFMRKLCRLYVESHIHYNNNNLSKKPTHVYLCIEHIRYAICACKINLKKKRSISCNLLCTSFHY